MKINNLDDVSSMIVVVMIIIKGLEIMAMMSSIMTVIMILICSRW